MIHKTSYWTVFWIINIWGVGCWVAHLVRWFWGWLSWIESNLCQCRLWDKTGFVSPKGFMGGIQLAGIAMFIAWAASVGCRSTCDLLFVQRVWLGLLHSRFAHVQLVAVVWQEAGGWSWRRTTSCLHTLKPSTVVYMSMFLLYIANWTSQIWVGLEMPKSLVWAAKMSVPSVLLSLLSSDYGHVTPADLSLGMPFPLSFPEEPMKMIFSKDGTFHEVSLCSTDTQEFRCEQKYKNRMKGRAMLLRC